MSGMRHVIKVRRLVPYAAGFEGPILFVLWVLFMMGLASSPSVLAQTQTQEAVAVPIPDKLTPRAVAMARAQMEAQMAVSVPGTRVCRELHVGIAESDWIRGVVISAMGDQIQIRIDDPGNYSQLINGLMLRKNRVVPDRAEHWTPCL